MYDLMQLQVAVFLECFVTYKTGGWCVFPAFCMHSSLMSLEFIFSSETLFALDTAKWIHSCVHVNVCFHTVISKTIAMISKKAIDVFRKDALARDNIYFYIKL